MPVEKINALVGSGSNDQATFCYTKIAKYVFILNSNLEIEKVIPLDGNEIAYWDFTSDEEYAYGNYNDKDFILFNEYTSKPGRYNTIALHILEINSKTFASKVVEIGYKDSKTRISQAPKDIDFTIGKSGKLYFTGDHHCSFGLGSYKLQPNN
jgi:hypothetical protein